MKRALLHPRYAAIAAALVLALGAWLLLANAGRAAANAHAAAAPATVQIKNFAYMPKTLTVSAGATVTFVNHDTTNHTVTANNGSFNISNLSPGHSTKVHFSKPGTYQYHCTFHPFMHGTIIVK